MCVVQLTSVHYAIVKKHYTSNETDIMLIIQLLWLVLNDFSGDKCQMSRITQLITDLGSIHETVKTRLHLSRSSSILSHSLPFSPILACSPLPFPHLSLAPSLHLNFGLSLHLLLPSSVAVLSCLILSCHSLLPHSLYVSCPSQSAPNYLHPRCFFIPISSLPTSSSRFTLHILRTQL